MTKTEQLFDEVITTIQSAWKFMDILTITTNELQVFGLHISISLSHHTKLHYVWHSSRFLGLVKPPDHYDSIKDFIAYTSVYKTVLMQSRIDSDLNGR
jgi:hypothetical protein